MVLGVFEYIPGMLVGLWAREGLRIGPGREGWDWVGRLRDGLLGKGGVVGCSGLARLFARVGLSTARTTWSGLLVCYDEGMDREGNPGPWSW